LGGIVIRRDLPEDVQQCVERVLRRSIEYAFEHPMLSREFVKQHAQELEDDVIDKHISLFVNDFSLSLGKEGREAMTFLTGLAEL
jgi:1,4-dihydroxy-6-naphthoate synthase